MSIDDRDRSDELRQRILDGASVVDDPELQRLLIELAPLDADVPRRTLQHLEPAGTNAQRTNERGWHHTHIVPLAA